MNRKLEKLPRLDANTFSKVQQLAEECQRYDGHKVKQYWNIIKDRRTSEFDDILYYENGKLVGYLATYVFKVGEAEISALVHPDHRRNYIFRHLYAEAQIELDKRSITKYLLVSKHDFVPGTTAIKNLGAIYKHSEYEMCLQKQQATLPDLAETHLKLKHPRAEHIPTMANMDKLCFEADLDDATSHLHKVLNHKDKKIWMAFLDNKPIGKIHVRFEKGCGFIHDFCVLAEYRGKGFGLYILTETIKYLFTINVKNVTLDVTCSNENALNLYRRCGFQVLHDYDFWELMR